MTTSDEITKNCYVCNKASTHAKIMSTNTFGSPDLDTRPPEMERSTISMWVQICPSCGYSSSNISEVNEKALEVIYTDSYQKQFKSPEFPKLANAFLCFSLIQKNNCEYSKAGWNSIHAAWACDDADYETSAQKCRMRAVSLFRKAKENNQKFAGQDGLEEAIIVDLLRRSRQFELALSTCDDGLKKKPEKIISDILQFQKMLIKNKDIACHRIADVIGDAKAVEPLIEELKDKHYLVRRSAAKALGKIGDVKAVEPLVEALKDENYHVRSNAAKALGKIRDAKAVEPLVEALKDEDNTFLDEDNTFLNVQWEAAEALGEIGGERAVELLIRVLKNKNKDVREGAAYALGKIGDARAMEPLIQTLKDKDYHVRWRVAASLGKLGKQVIEPLIQALGDENKDVRWGAAAALGDIRDARAVEPLIQVLRDKNKDIRMRTAVALGNIRNARAVEPLIHALTDEDDDVRNEAVWALGEIGDARAVEYLVKTLSDKNTEVRRRAADALEKIEKL
ncbi:MAG: DUF2225 domain-containing protein [Candidatus Methanoperedens sp.]|nr:DUF2225 domain-containing protein [Candidatus Methanoperedens sp. BLZ2]MBZ0174711.1 DUF2225 domain-containing protein [Candidatus Methanoperedens nitroreducens]MCX9080055.1 DUF2225 domain-containing protein [Candidatus Methanoperedens sp.]